MKEVTLQHSKSGIEFVVTESVAAELVQRGEASYTKPVIEVSEAEPVKADPKPKKTKE